MRYIKLNEQNKVMSIRFGESIVDGEIQSDLGELGQIQQVDGIFVDDTTPVIPQPYTPTNIEIAQMISDLQADLVVAGVIK